MEDTNYRADNGRFLAPPPGSEKTRITTENARSMVQRRWEKYRRAAVERILGEAQSIDASVKTPADAYGLLVAKQYTTLLDSEKPAIEQVDRLGRMLTGMDTEARRENASAQPVSGVTASPEALLRLAELIEAELAGRVERARAVDVEAEDVEP